MSFTSTSNITILFSDFPASFFSHKDILDYMEPTPIIQDGLSISDSLIRWSPFAMYGNIDTDCRDEGMGLGEGAFFLAV